MLAIDVGSKCLNFLGFDRWEMGDFGGRKAKRYPLTMLPKHRNSDRDSVQLQRQTLKLSEMNTREHFCQKRYTGHSSRFSYLFCWKLQCSEKNKTNKPEPSTLNMFPSTKKKWRALSPQLSLQKTDVQHFLQRPISPRGLGGRRAAIPASIFRRFPRGALPTRPCHSFVHRSQTQLGDGADGWGSLGWWEVGCPDVPVKGYGIAGIFTYMDDLNLW